MSEPEKQSADKRQASEAEENSSLMSSASHHYVFFSARYYPLVGGVESYTAHIAHELAQLGNRVSVVTMRVDDSPVQSYYPENVETIRLPCRPLLNGRLPIPVKNSEYNELLASIMSKSPDRIVVNTRFYPHSIQGLKFAKQLNKRAVLIEHGSAYLTMGNTIIDKAIQAYERRITTKVKKFNPLFCGVSKKCTQWLGNFGIHTEQVISNAVDADLFKNGSSNKSYRDLLGISSDSMLVAFSGRLEPEKGIDKLAEAAIILEQQGIEFAIAGDGSLREQLTKDAPHNMHFLGVLNHADLAALFCDSDLFCLPTRSEGFCTSLLEASTCGLPSLITDVGGAREVICDNSYGRILENDKPSTIAQEIINLKSTGKDNLKSMGNRTRKRVKTNFNWATSAKVLEELFNENGL